MGDLIDCRDVWKIYRVGAVEVPALRGVTLRVQRGEFIAILGSSGGSGHTSADSFEPEQPLRAAAAAAAAANLRTALIPVIVFSPRVIVS